MTQDNQAPDAGRWCTRPTKAGRSCKSGRVTWYRSSQPDPQSCRSHLTPDEAAELKRTHERFLAEWAPYWARQEAKLAGDPACWSWEPPTPEDIAQMKNSYSPAVREHMPENAWPAIMMSQWHDGRCAICGDTAPLVEDHDHQTGLVRGYLCQSCNTLEGVRRGGIWDKYRERSPASICDVRERYWHPIKQAYAEPAVPPGDKWNDNPMRGIGL